MSKEEQERIARELAEKIRLEELLLKERDAELRQEAENDRRDFEEAEERKRAKKEEQIRLMAQKDSRILSLATELETQKVLHGAERSELETELERLLQLRESLLNEISSLRSESDETIRNLIDERGRVIDEHQSTTSNLEDLRSTHRQHVDDARREKDALTSQNADLVKANESLVSEKEQQERDLTMRIKALEREVEKLSSLNATLQDVVESREADDRKNVTLMQLLNNQLDESKRRSQEILDEERQVCAKLKQSNIQLESKSQQLTDELDLLRREKEQLQRQAESDLHDYQSKIEQLKFDMKYLHSELHSFKNQCSKQQQEVSSVRASAMAESQTTKLEVDTLQRRIEELETILRKKDREHFDKSTFLNAQVANNRTIIAQLQQKLRDEQDSRESQVKTMQSELEDKSVALITLSSDMEKRRVISGDAEMRLASDNSILKSTVYQLQAALVDREKEIDSVIAAKDEELFRLRRKLDENFIPHRNDAAADDVRPLDSILGEKILKLTKDLELKTKAANDVELRYKGQLSNQGLIIDSLQAELAQAQSDGNDRHQKMLAENDFLKQLLDTHHVPYKN